MYGLELAKNEVKMVVCDGEGLLLIVPAQRVAKSCWRNVERCKNGGMRLG